MKGAALEHGLLVIDLEREIPESMKPRKVEIKVTNAKPAVIDAPQAA